MDKSFSIAHILAPSCALLSLTLISGILLSSSHSSASTASASVTVSSACTLTGSLDSPHTASISSGTYEENIGTTTLKAICNDSNGYSIYAVGYTNNEFGRTDLEAIINGSLSPTDNINTGTATSGETSNWAMKLTPVSGTYAPTILSDADGTFSNYHKIPSTYTKVATLTSSTDATTGSSIQSTYAAYISKDQSAGDYNGKVRYTLVHPSSNIPNEEKDCPTGNICYWPNAGNEVTDNMGDQTITATATSATLWPTNFQRPGYGFVGWNDKFDYTGTNYGPMETVENLDLSESGLSLYAIWVKSEGTLQNWNGCSAMTTGQVTALTDSRDNNTYAVAKLADGKCWMIENMRLGGSTTTTLTPTDSIVSTNTTLPATTSSWSISNYTQMQLNADNTISPVTNMTTPTNANIYSYGNYYSWAAFIASTTAVSSGNASTSICPTGWRMPTGTNTGDLYALNAAVNSGSINTSAGLRAYPTNLLHSGYYYGSLANNRGSYGRYWASTAYNSGSAYYLRFYGSDVSPGTGIGSDKNLGHSARCLVGS